VYVKWIQLVEDTSQCQASMTMVMKCEVKVRRKLLVQLNISNCSRELLYSGVTIVT